MLPARFFKLLPQLQRPANIPSETYPERSICIFAKPDDSGTEHLLCSSLANTSPCRHTSVDINTMGSMGHGANATAYSCNLWAGCMMAEEEFKTHSASMFTRAVSLAYGDSVIVNALLEQSKNGQQPFGPFVMPEIPPCVIMCLDYPWHI